MEDSKFLSRKFTMAVFVILVSVPLVIFKIITPDAYVMLNGTTLGLYFTGNVVNKFTISDIRGVSVDRASG